jgi:putative membrane protein
MNIHTQTKPAVDQDTVRRSPLIGRSPVARLALFLTVGLFLAVPNIRAEASLAHADKKFILAAAQGGMTEVKLGELAAQNGMRDDVKAFGQIMVKDHTAIIDDLKALAVQKGVTLPDGLDSKHQRMVDKMAALTGSAFDDAYIVRMIKAHTADAKAFNAEAAETKDEDIKSFVAKSIPVVEDHLKRVTAMKK